MQKQAEDIKFKVGDPVLVLLGQGGQEWVEQAEVAVVRDDRLVLRMTDRPGDCFLPVHARYVLHQCRDCGREAVPVAGAQCGPCWADDLESENWIRATTRIYRFRWASPYLQTERPVRGAA